MTTPRIIIRSSLRKIGVAGQGEDIEHEEANDALDLLNEMLALWSIDGLVVPYKTITTLADGVGYSSGSSSYTIAAAGANIALDRPIDVDAIQLVSGSSVIDLDKYNRDQWEGRSDSGSNPCGYYYLDTSPIATLYFDGSLPAGYSLRLITSQPLGTFALDDEITLPAEYTLLIKSELAIRCIPEFEADVSNVAFEILTNEVRDAKNLIRINNAESGEVDIDPAVLGGSRNYAYSRGLF